MTDCAVAAASGRTSLRGLQERMVMDGSVLKNDVKQILAKERREERERQQEASKEMQLLEKARKTKLQYEKQLEERQRKLKEQKEKDEQRRISAEVKRKQKLAEDREKFQAVLSRTMERSSRVNCRQKRFLCEGPVVNPESKSGKTENKRSSSSNRREIKVHSCIDTKHMDNKPARHVYNSPRGNNLISCPLIPTRTSGDKSAASSSVTEKNAPGISKPVFLCVTVPFPRRSIDEPKASVMFCKSTVKMPLEKVEIPLSANADVSRKASMEVPSKENAEVPLKANVEAPPDMHMEAALEMNVDTPPEVNMDVLPMASMDTSSSASVESSSMESVESFPLVSVEASPLVIMDISPKVNADPVSIEMPPEINMEASREESILMPPELNVEAPSGANAEVSPDTIVEPSPEADAEASTEASVTEASTKASVVGVLLEANAEGPFEANVELPPEVNVEADPDTEVEASPEESLEAPPKTSMEVLPKKPELDKQTSYPITKKHPLSNIPHYRWPCILASGWRPFSPINTIRKIQKNCPPSSSVSTSKQSTETFLSYKITPVQCTLFVANALGTVEKKTISNATSKCEAVSQKRMFYEESSNKSAPEIKSADSGTKILSERCHLAHEQKDKNEEERFQVDTEPSITRKVEDVAEKVDESQVEESSKCEDVQQEKELNKSKGCQVQEDPEVLLQKGDAKIKAQEDAEKHKKEHKRIMLQNLQERLERKMATETSGKDTSEEDEADDEDETESDKD